MKCKHKNAVTVSIGRTWIAEGPGKEGRAADVRRGICLDCQAWLPLGSSNDSPEAVRVEVVLARLIAEADDKYEGEAFDECCDIYIDIFADDSTPHPYLRKPGPRSPIEIMVDRACGIETLPPSTEQRVKEGL